MALTKVKDSQVTFKSEATGAVVRGLKDKLSDVVSVKDFGAIGDGVTDDTAAIQAAIDNSNNVFFPVGTYKITSQLVGKTKLTLRGACPQLMEMDSDNLVSIQARVADLGDGVAMFKAAPGTTQIQSVSIENIRFAGDNTSVVFSNLTTATNTGVVGIDPSGIKQGFYVKNCCFRRLKTGIETISGHGYLGHTLLDNCSFYLSYKAFNISPTTGLGLNSCAVYDCYTIGETNRVTSTNCSFNNSSYASRFNSRLQFDIGMFDGLWIEGFNNTLQPSKYLSVKGSKFSESYDDGTGSLKNTIKLQGNNITVEVSGTFIATNTRLIDFINVTDFTTIRLYLKQNYNGTLFGDSSTGTTAATFVSQGGALEGIGNANSTWNVLEGFSDQRGYEGTYTASLTPETSGTITLNTSSDLLAYNKNGQVVTVTGSLTISSVSSPVGSYIELNLPLAIASKTDTAERFGGGTTFFDSSASAWSVVPMQGVTGSTVRIYQAASTIAGSDQFYFSFSYMTDA